MNFLDYVTGVDADNQRQIQMAAALRKQTEQKLADAYQKSQQNNALEVLAPLLNNPALEKAIGILGKQAGDAAPKMTASGAIIPSTGEFVDNPQVADQKIQDRQARLDSMIGQQLAAGERASEANQLRLSIAQMGDATRREIAASNRALKESLAAAKRDEKKGDGGRPLPASAVKDLTGRANTVAQMIDIENGFKDEYAGTAGLADSQNLMGKFNPLGLGEKWKAQSNWWQNYSEFANQVRHGLFGSALTENELKAFNQAMVEPGMDSSQLRTRIRQQRTILTQAYQRMKKGFAGYDVSGLEDFEVPQAALPGGAAPAAKPTAPPAAAPAAAPSSKKRLKFNPATGMLE